MKLIVVVGTRPEAIKMAPVIRRLREEPGCRTILCATAQHRQMLDQVLALFALAPDVDLDLMRPDQTMNELSSRVFAGIDAVLDREKPDWLLVQGDTTTAMCASIAAFHRRVRVGHVEAGLRTGDFDHPFPEEMNRRVVDLVSAANFVPTQRAARALAAEDVPPEKIFLTGNTVVDALLAIAGREGEVAEEDLVLITAHRRESFGEPLERVVRAIGRLATGFPRTRFVHVLHPNPNVGPVVRRNAGLPNVELVEPLDYLALVRLMRRARLILTDSGGIQEEAPTFHKPVLVLREKTERPEGVEAGLAELVGTDEEKIVARASALLSARGAAASPADGPLQPLRRRARLGADRGHPHGPALHPVRPARMKPDWESGLRGRIYAFGRRLTPLALRRALRRHVRPERLLGIRKPPVELARFDFDPGSARPGRADILVLPVIAWSYRRQRPQQLAEALARRGTRVFYGSLGGTDEPREPTGVAPGVMLLPLDGVRREDPADRRLQDPALAAALDGLAAARASVRPPGRRRARRVALLGPARRGPARAIRLAHRRTTASTRTKPSRPTAPASWTSPSARWRRTPISSSPLPRPCGSGWRRGTRSARLLPNACDFALFAAIPDPDPGAREGRLAVGYAGAVDEWFDMALVAELAALRPSWSFEIVGGLEGAGASRDTPRLPNLVFRGERPHGEMPAFRARCDVEIIPFRLSALTHATDPVKLYEAAAAGRTVVATPMRSLEPFAQRGVVRLAASAREFAQQIEAAAAEGAAGAARQRAFARRQHLGHPRRDARGLVDRGPGACNREP